MQTGVLLILNTITFATVLILNYMSGTGAIGRTTIGEISGRYETLFTPAGYAFSIWGIIYLFLAGFMLFLWYQWIRYKKDGILKQAGTLFALSNLANSSWLFAWINEYLGLSVLLMLLLLICLIGLVIRLQPHAQGKSVKMHLLVWWPFVIYLGWIIVATVANISAFLVSLEWSGGILQEQTWSVLMILIAACIYFALGTWKRMPEPTLVAVWALIAIAVKQQAYGPVKYAAIIAAVILAIAFIWQILRTSGMNANT